MGQAASVAGRAAGFKRREDNGAWDGAQLLETDNMGSAGFARVAMDPQGNAMAIWEQYGRTRTKIWSNRYVPGRGWGLAQLVETNDASAFVPQIALDGEGNALAVWVQGDGAEFGIWANRWVAP